MIRWFFSVFAVLSVLCLAQPASAQSCSGTLGTESFGTVDLTTGQGYPTSATFTVTCNGTNGQQFAACSSAGASGPYSMGGVSFSLFLDQAGSIPWSFNTTVAIGSTLSGNSTPQTVYARLAAGQQQLAPAIYTATGQIALFAYNTYTTVPSCAGGASASVVIPATANYPATCTISALPMTFNAAGLSAASADATTTVSAKCSSTWPYNILLNGGVNPIPGVSDPPQRRMVLAGRYINYGLFRDAARNQPWGSTIGANAVAGTGSGTPQNVTVYGRIPLQPSPPPGTYTDLITVTVSY